MKALPYILILSTLIIFNSCRKDEVDIVTEQNKEEGPRIYHDANITGKVVNQDNDPVKAEVSILGQVMASDENGAFLFVNTRVNAQGSLVKSMAKGHLPGYQTVHAKLNEVVSIEVVLKEIISAIPLNSDEPLELTLGSNAKAIIGNSMFEYIDGSPFSGNAAIIFQYYNKNEAADNIPATLMSQDPIFDIGPLEIEGAFLILAYDDNGEILRLKNDSSFNLTVSKEVSNAALFNLDEEKELWVEDVRASFQPNAFTIKINKLGFKALGRQLKESSVTGRFIDGNGEGIPSMSALIVGDQISYPIITDANGKFNANLALNQEYTLRAIDPCTKDEITSNFYTDNITTEAPSLEFTTVLTKVSFEIMECNFESFITQEGLIVSTMSGSQCMNYRFSDGKIDLALLLCNDDAELTLFDGHNVIDNFSLQGLVELGEENDLVRHHLCAPEVEAIISFGGEMIQYSDEGFTIAVDGTFPNQFFSFFDLDFNGSFGIDGISGKGVYPVTEMDFFLPVDVDCDPGECGDVFMIVTKYASQKGDEMIVHVIGEFNGLEVQAYIKDYRLD